MQRHFLGFYKVARQRDNALLINVYLCLFIVGLAKEAL